MALFGIGNPLLDIIVTVDSAFLDKYSLLPNNAILAEPQHMPLYEEILDRKDAQHVAGGASQNTLRCAQWLLPKGSTVYTGATGNDAASEIIRKKATEDGLTVIYQKIDNQKTGTCAVLISKAGTARSLVANVAAAQHFSYDAVSSMDNGAARRAISAARVIYCTGFFMFSCPTAVREIVNIARTENKIMAFNLSATFACSNQGPFAETLDYALPLCDIVICNYEELLAYAEPRNWGIELLHEVMEQFVRVDSTNKEIAAPAKRILVVTDGAEEINVVVRDMKTNTVEFFKTKVPVIPASELVDTNGAGDAFSGGFLSQLILNKPVSESVNAGIYAAGHVIRQSGVVFPKVEIPESFAKLF